jgi:quercetin dioxygenase-like cupin family protein
MNFGAHGYALAAGEGEGLWFLDGLMTVKAAGSDTRNAFTLIEAERQAGSGPAPHIHHDEEEAFYLLEGELTITCGEQTWTASPGAFALLPRGIPHSWRASDAANAKNVADHLSRAV